MVLEELTNIHTAMYLELSRAGRNSAVGTPGSTSLAAPDLGQVFLRWKGKLVAYSEYCASLPKAQARVEALCESSSSVRAKIVECQADANENRFRLQDLLAVPMQRVLKYHLLFRELDKSTSIDHQEKASISQAFDAMLDLSVYINVVKGDSEMLKLFKDIQNSISDLPMPEKTELKDYGRLLKDGEVRLCSTDDRKIKSRYVFVFDKVLIVCNCKNMKGSQYSYKSALLLSDYRLVRSDSDSKYTLGTLFKGTKAGLSFSLVHKEGKDTLQFHFKSREVSEAWANAVAMAHDNVKPKGARESDHMWQYTSMEDAQECWSCGKLLRGLFYQGYRCQQCDILGHKECMRPDRTDTWHRHKSSPSSTLIPELDSLTLVPPTPAAASTPSPTGYVNMDDLNSYTWYCGPLERDVAEQRLKGMPNGTFMVRLSGNTGRYAISISYKDEVKHMRIEEGECGYWLEESTSFVAIVDLVRHYGEHSLEEAFQVWIKDRKEGLHTTLAVPYKQTVVRWPSTPF